jgi:hypothetical protein
METNVPDDQHGQSELVELFEERAGILEFEAKMSRTKAEYEAAMELRRRYGRDNLPMIVREIGNAAFKKLQE